MLTGQQQLLCLARVLLRRPRIVCLDECTASVDPRTAQLMQELVAKELSSASIIQVCHSCSRLAVRDLRSLGLLHDTEQVACAGESACA